MEIHATASTCEGCTANKSATRKGAARSHGAARRPGRGGIAARLVPEGATADGVVGPALAECVEGFSLGGINPDLEVPVQAHGEVEVIHREIVVHLGVRVI